MLRIAIHCWLVGVCVVGLVLVFLGIGVWRARSIVCTRSVVCLLLCRVGIRWLVLFGGSGCMCACSWFYYNEFACECTIGRKVAWLWDSMVGSSLFPMKSRLAVLVFLFCFSRLFCETRKLAAYFLPGPVAGARDV